MKKIILLMLAFGMFSGASLAGTPAVNSGDNDVIEQFGGTRNGGDC